MLYNRQLSEYRRLLRSGSSPRGVLLGELCHRGCEDQLGGGFHNGVILFHDRKHWCKYPYIPFGLPISFYRLYAVGSIPAKSLLRRCWTAVASHTPFQLQVLKVVVLSLALSRVLVKSSLGSSDTRRDTLYF